MLGPHTLRITHSAKIPPLHTCLSPPSSPVDLRWSLSPLNGHGRIKQLSPPCSTTRGAGEGLGLRVRQSALKRSTLHYRTTLASREVQAQTRRTRV